MGTIINCFSQKVAIIVWIKIEDWLLEGYLTIHIGNKLFASNCTINPKAILICDNENFVVLHFICLEFLHIKSLWSLPTVSKEIGIQCVFSGPNNEFISIGSQIEKYQLSVC